MRRAASDPVRGRLGRPAPRASRERGAVALLVGVLIIVLIGFVALAVDMGQMYRARGELQNAADSAALAGAQRLDRSMAGLARARATAHTYAGLHDAVSTPVVVADGDISFGHWDNAARSYTPLAEDESMVTAINAIKVIGRRDAASGNAVALKFAPLIGREAADIAADAVAVGGGPMNACGFPMVVADCSLDVPISEGLCQYCMTYQDNNTDNAGWTSFDESSVGGPTISSIIRSSCMAADGTVLIDPVTHECAGECYATSVDDEIKVSNGNNMNTGNNNFCSVIQTILTRGINHGPAIPFVVRVPVLRSTSGTCDGSQFSSYHDVAGYAVMEIFGARCSNSDPGVLAPAPPCAPPSSGKYIGASLRCDLEPEGTAGGGYYGLLARHTRLIQ